MLYFMGSFSKPRTLRHGARDQIFQAPSPFFGRYEANTYSTISDMHVLTKKKRQEVALQFISLISRPSSAFWRHRKRQMLGEAWERG